MIRVLVSACLLGEKVRYNGADAFAASRILTAWLAEGRVVPFCPEVAGGLDVPRPAAEILQGEGRHVLDGTRTVVTVGGTDVTPAFLKGARQALQQARAHDVGVAVLKDGSPSCGSTFIYDGSFEGVRRAGQGVTAALLEDNGIRVFSERQLTEAAACLERLENTTAQSERGH
jgi:uncharacterized protein YbbK (DUF523 family)